MFNLWIKLNYFFVFFYRFCGTALGYCKEGTTAGSCNKQLGAVTTFTKPFIVGVVTNENEATDSKSNRGFNILYSQQPCLTSGWNYYNTF